MLLALTVGLTAWVGLYLWLGAAGEGPTPPEPAAEAHEHYLPHASVWPFAIGLGAPRWPTGWCWGCG